MHPAAAPTAAPDPSSAAGLGYLCHVQRDPMCRGFCEQERQVKDLEDLDRGKHYAEIYWQVITDTAKNVRRRLTFPSEDLTWTKVETIREGKSACPACSPSNALSLLHTALQINSVQDRDEDYLMFC